MFFIERTSSLPAAFCAWRDGGLEPKPWNLLGKGSR
jgi:hypothetical protein